MRAIVTLDGFVVLDCALEHLHNNSIRATGRIKIQIVSRYA